MATAKAKTFKTIYEFTNSTGGSPNSGLIADKAGTLYGTNCNNCGDNPVQGYGTIYEFDPKTKSLTTLYSFTGGADGAYPYGGLVLDADGNLCGTTESGGEHDAGTIFRFNPATHTLSTLYTFTGQGDGANPGWAALIFEPNGNLDGTTINGGSGGLGTVFTFNPATQVLTTRHSFQGGDGANPISALVRDKKGNLYGAAESGGTYGHGAIYKLLSKSAMLVSLHNFTGGSDGSLPESVLVFDKEGLLYGTTATGGDTAACGGEGCGVVFEIDPATKAFTPLYSLTGGSDGAHVVASGVIFDKAMALYGTTYSGGNLNDCNGAGCGTVFRLDPTSSTLTVLHTFDGSDGAATQSGLLIKGQALYGTTYLGGTHGVGTIFTLPP